MSVGPDEPSESADNLPTELHFEEMEATEIQPVDVIEPAPSNLPSDDNESPLPESAHDLNESGYAEPTSTFPPDSTRTKAKHRWMMRAFFAAILVVIYILLYWQHAVR
jgi:hypothetical protein